MGPCCPLPLNICPFTPFGRLGGVVEPARTGNSSAFGTRCWCLNVAAFFWAWPVGPLWGCLPPCWNLGRFPASLEWERLDPSTPFFWRGGSWFNLVKKSRRPPRKINTHVTNGQVAKLGFEVSKPIDPVGLDSRSGRTNPNRRELGLNRISPIFSKYMWETTVIAKRKVRYRISS